MFAVMRSWAVGTLLLVTNRPISSCFCTHPIMKQECQSECASRDVREATSKNGNSNQQRAVEQSVFMFVSDNNGRSLPTAALLNCTHYAHFVPLFDDHSILV